jgi:serine acetyltransferase/GT2 family glycosyltransferase
VTGRFKASVVIATHGRPEALCRLVRQLGEQSIEKRGYEVVVVDDGSPEPVAKRLAALAPPMHLTVATQRNAGPAVARDVGARLAQGEVLVILDDDMQVGPRFLEGHLGFHRPDEPIVVLGHMRPDPALETMPLFERFHARQLDAMVAGFRSGSVVPRGHHLYTGNVSMRRADYLATGGFDPSLRRSEDRELGLRLEALGARFVFAEGDAESIHSSDHTERRVWLERARLYGIHEVRIARKHPRMEEADPWRFIARVSPAARPLYVLSALAPRLGRRLGRGALAVSEGLDRLGWERAALAGTTLAYGSAYFGGVGEAGRGVTPVVAALGRRLSPGLLDRWAHAVRADHDCLRRYRARYAQEEIPPEALPRHLVEKVGLQLLATVRLMHVFEAAGHETAARVTSRIIRHLYGSDIHWRAEIAPGVMVVHGMGIAISHGARVGPGCVLSQNVTLGEGIDATSRRVGAPRLERDVHVGPGVTILGPVVVGAGSKIMAGSVLCRSVPPGSLVTSSQAAASPRPRRPAPALAPLNGSGRGLGRKEANPT